MKVLFFNYEYPPLGGGAGNAASYILREFSKIPDLEVDLVTSSADNKFHLERVGENIRIHKISIGKNQSNFHFQSQKDLLVYSWKAFLYSRKLLGKQRYDLTHSFFTVPCGFLSLVFKCFYGLPYVVSLRGADVPGYAERFDLTYKILSPMIKLIWSNSSAVVSNSEGLKDLALETKPEQKIKIIRNGIDTDFFKPDPSLRKRSEFIITLGGTRITVRKGIRYLIEAVRLLSKNHPRLSATIIGEGSERENLEKMSEKLGIKDKIRFVGRVENSRKVAPYYREADVFVLPSLNEGMSNAMLEALASGLPIIATDTGGTKELVEEGKNGFVVKMKDSSDLAEKIGKLIEDEDLRRNMGRKSRERATEMSWDKVAGEYHRLYEEVAGICDFCKFV